MKNLRSAIAALAILLPVAPAAAQVNSTNLPVNTVMGRLGITAGPVQAIPFATLLTQIAAVPTSRTISTTSPLSGGGTLAADRTLSISTNGISNSLFRQSGALSLVGRSANSTGDVADISASAGSSCVFRESSSTLACTTIATASIANNAVDNTKIRQSAALSLIGRSANSTGDVADISASAASDCVFRESSSAVGCGTVATAGIANSAVSNAKLANAAAYTVKGNATGSSAAPTDISIPALTQKASPAANDKVMLADSAASDALKYATVSSLASAGSVSSIAGNTGAFTLSTGITNSTNDIRLSLTNATTQAGPTNLAATTSTTAKMMGMGAASCTITPVYSTRVRVRIEGYFVAGNVTTARSQAKFGTGTAPANGDADTGTALGSIKSTTLAAASYEQSFSVGGIKTGLSVGTTYWFDANYLTSSGNSITPTSVSCSLMEF